MRHKARHYALQALYQWQMANSPLLQIEREFFSDYDMKNVDVEYFRELLHNIPAQLTELDGHYIELLDRTFDELDPVERALLRIGCYELLNRIDVPYRVVLNEAVTLAKKFGATDSYKYINGVLDKVAEQHRSIEISAEKAL